MCFLSLPHRSPPFLGYPPPPSPPPPLFLLSGADLVVNTAGPFQRSTSCTVLEAAIATKVGERRRGGERRGEERKRGEEMRGGEGREEERR